MESDADPALMQEDTPEYRTSITPETLYRMLAVIINENVLRGTEARTTSYSPVN